MAENILPGYSTKWGNKNVFSSDHLGPASYQAGGESFTAQHLGWGGVEHVFIDGPSWNANNNGTYFTKVQFPTASAGARSSVQILWYVAANNAEVGNNTDLSAEKVRLLAIGV